MKKVKASMIYPIEPWTITENLFDKSLNKRNETIFTVGNGYIGMRAFTEEDTPELEDDSFPGIYINGFYESAPIQYGEVAFGYAKNHQTILNVPNTLMMNIWADDEPVNLFSGMISHYFRKLDLKNGWMTRGYQWTSKTSGKTLNICFKRFVSFTRKHIAVDTLTIKQGDEKAAIRVVSSINPSVTNRESENDPRTGSHLSKQVLQLKEVINDAGILGMIQQTRSSVLFLCTEIKHSQQGTISSDRNLFSETFDFGKTDVSLTKYIGYTTSEQKSSKGSEEVLRKELSEAFEVGTEQLMAEQKEYLNEFWKVADVAVDGDRALEQAIHYNSFQLLQSAGRDGKTNIAAKGVTGEGYEGHYFWDSEIFIFPFFLFTRPEIAKAFLTYRYSILPKAKERAAEMGCKGALFPWRTINGEEASAYYPAGTAQIHINADIMYALKQYVTVTGDEAFLKEKGLEMLIETSRFYLSYGSFVPDRGFVLDCVTGPDEYTALINNNSYTNIMVKDQLEYLLSHLSISDLQKYQITKEEYQLFKRAASEMYIFRKGDLIGQDDSFLSKGKWNFESASSDQYPLLLHFHPLTIYRRQVLKQADLILAMILQNSRFTDKEKEVNYDYYEPLTTHDSSLSTSAHAILAAELGRVETAINFFYYTARADLDDYHHNIVDGIHTAAMAGSWLTIVYGFAGLRIKEGILHFHPLLPERWGSYSFSIQYRDTVLKVAINNNDTIYSRIKGKPITIYHMKEKRII